MTPYDVIEIPPAPICTIELFATTPWGTTAAVKTRMIIDTGADRSCVPEDTIRQLEAALNIRGLPHSYTFVLDFFSRKRIYTKQYRLTTGVGHLGNGRDFTFLETNDSLGVLGRDILNLHFLDLDGPQGQWTFL